MYILINHYPQLCCLSWGGDCHALLKLSSYTDMQIIRSPTFETSKSLNTLYIRGFMNIDLSDTFAIVNNGIHKIYMKILLFHFICKISKHIIYKLSRA